MNIEPIKSRKQIEFSFIPHKVRWTSEKVSRIWDYYGSKTCYKNERFSFHSGKQIINWVNSVFTLKDKVIIDYGCGVGDLLKHLHSITAIKESYGVEFSNESLIAVRKQLDSFPNFKGVFLGQKHPIDLPSSGLVDVVFLIEVVEHLEQYELEITFKEINRLLKNSGVLVLTTPNKENVEAKKRICPDCGAIFHPKQHVRSWSEKNLIQTLEDFGFKRIAVTETNWTYRGKSYLTSLISRIVNILRGNKKVNKQHLGIIVKKIEINNES